MALFPYRPSGEVGVWPVGHGQVRMGGSGRPDPPRWVQNHRVDQEESEDKEEGNQNNILSPTAGFPSVSNIH